MALNFPNSPTEGQIYTDTPSGNRWVWDSANTVWKSTSTFTQTITVASTAPGTPVIGQLWWNQEYGRLLVYYSDGTSSQWVDASPSDYTSGLAYGQANTVFGVANAAFGKANTALQNTSGTFAGALTTTGAITANSYLYITPVGGEEGGEIQLNATGSNTSWSIDSYQNNFRVFARSGSTVSNVNFFHATGGYIGMGVGTTTPGNYNDSAGSIMTVAGIGTTRPATIVQRGNDASPGAGYRAVETFYVAAVTSAVEITRITGTGANGLGMYIKIVVTGHSASIDNGCNIKEYFYVGGTSSPTQITSATAGSGVPVISFDVSVSNRLIIKLASSNGVTTFNGVMKVEWLVPVDFGGSNWTIS